MNEELLDKLGSLIVKRVRDEVISSIDSAMKGARPDIYGRKLYELSQSQPDATKDFVYQLIPYIIDGTISVEVDPKTWTTPKGKRIITEWS